MRSGGASGESLVILAAAAGAADLNSLSSSPARAFIPASSAMTARQEMDRTMVTLLLNTQERGTYLPLSSYSIPRRDDFVVHAEFVGCDGRTSRARTASAPGPGDIVRDW